MDIVKYVTGGTVVIWEIGGLYKMKQRNQDTTLGTKITMTEENSPLRLLTI